MEGYIYVIENTLNGKKYVGKTLKSINKRFLEHCRDSKRFKNRPLYRAMNKYGYENFSIKTIEQVKSENIGERETYWILFYNTYKNGYNATLGGDGKTRCSRKAIKSFVILFSKGIAIKEISKQTGFCVDTIRLYLQGEGFDTSKNGSSGSKKTYANKGISKKIQMNSKNGEVIKIFVSLHDAARYLVSIKATINKSLDSIKSKITLNLTGKTCICYGFKFQYA